MLNKNELHLSNSWLCVSFLFVKEALQSFAFLVFVVVCIVGSVYLHIVLPETKNKTFMDISQSFAKINKIPVPSPSLEMELVRAFKPDVNDKVRDMAKMESSF